MRNEEMDIIEERFNNEETLQDKEYFLNEINKDLSELFRELEELQELQEPEEDEEEDEELESDGDTPKSKNGVKIKGDSGSCEKWNI